jgi:tripartite ATP-independent transporter DctM subunit
MYAGAMIPGLMLVGLYLLFIAAVAIFKPQWVPALPLEARVYREQDGSGGYRSLMLLIVASTLVAYLWATFYADIKVYFGRPAPASDEEVLIGAIMMGSLFALIAALANKTLRLNLLSRLSEQVTFVLIPPLALIFLVLGTIFLGIATPTEGGAMGAVGALIMAGVRGRLTAKVLGQALENSTKLSIFVMFILIGSTIFGFTFSAADGKVWVEHLFDKLPGGQIGFLIFVNLLVFGLGFFLDFFEIAFIVIPLLAPVAEKLDINLIWFGIIIAMNLQTSFLTPPFGFALFYLRSVAPRNDYIDAVTKKRIPKITTEQIYKGSIAFIVLQVIMVIVLLWQPQFDF